MPNEPKEKPEKPAAIDISKLRIEDIDQLGHEALKDAVRSVLRRGDVGRVAVDGHKDHRSHSNT